MGFFRFVRIIVGIVVCLVIGINMYLVALYVVGICFFYNVLMTLKKTKCFLKVHFIFIF